MDHYFKDSSAADHPQLIIVINHVSTGKKSKTDNFAVSHKTVLQTSTSHVNLGVLTNVVVVHLHNEFCRYLWCC